MNSFDDSDIKIFGSETKNDAKNVDADTEEQFNKQKENGNLARAQRLGATLANRVDQLDISVEDVHNEVTANHMRLLMIFSMVAGIEDDLSDRILVRTALNVFYDTLKKEKPKLYDSMSSSGAFTFYYLEYRRGGNTPDNIARAFAMLCGAEGDKKLIAAGKALFGGYFEYVGKLIEEMNFAR